MIQKIDIEKFGLYSDYKWKSSVGGDSNDIFSKINIMYGRNYSGKTTLSRIFRCLEQKKLHEKYEDGLFTITNDDGSVQSNDNLESPYNIRVYNSDFVKENLSVLYYETGEIKPFTLLGSHNIQVESEIKKISDELGDLEMGTGLLGQKKENEASIHNDEKLLNKKNKEIESKLRDEANHIIKPNHYYVPQGTNYNISSIKRDIDSIIATKLDCELSIEETKKYKIIIDEIQKPEQKKIPEVKPHLRERIDKVKELVERKIAVSSTIQELINDAVLQQWVEKGRKLHEKTKVCAFCGNLISPERFNILDAHFSKESKILKKEIESESFLLKKSKNIIKVYLDSMGIKKSNFYSILHDEYDEIEQQWNDFVSSYIERIEILEKALQNRFDDIFLPKIFDPVDDNSDELLEIIKRINELVVANNSKTDTLSKDKTESRKKLRYSEIYRFVSLIEYTKTIDEIARDNNDIKSKELALKELNTNISEKTKTLNDKKMELNDEGEAAKKVNSHLSNFFGHHSLSLIPEVLDGDASSTRFIIKRGEEKNACNLSEGECSLIAFCYFIAKMEDELKNNDSDKLVIYIDDPISSLDNNHIFFMFSLIESVICKPKKYGQLFISTHNLDFLKYIKRLTVPCASDNIKSINHFILEKEKKGDVYRCNLKKMPSYLKDYVTEYNFLFKQIYDIVKPLKGDRSKCYEHSFTHLYNLPNNMRKFLECYLFYRFPNTEKPINNLSKIFDNNIPSLVNRVVNEYSHLSWGDRGSIAYDVIEAETVAREILKAIKRKDKDHFDALCESISVDKEVQLD